jgi:hypothetical protein
VGADPSAGARAPSSPHELFPPAARRDSPPILPPPILPILTVDPASLAASRRPSIPPTEGCESRRESVIDPVTRRDSATLPSSLSTDGPRRDSVTEPVTRRESVTEPVTRRESVTMRAASILAARNLVAASPGSTHTHTHTGDFLSAHSRLMVIAK